MIVKDKHLTTIWYDNSSDKIKIIDQRLLPHEIKFVELNTLQDVCFAIQNMTEAPDKCTGLRWCVCKKVEDAN